MTALVVESWIWWSFVILVAGSRFISRRIVLGAFRRYQLDDWGMLAVLCFYTTFIPTINIVAHTSSNLIPPGTDIAAFTTQEIAERAYGSKLVVVVEQTQICSIWGAKACLLVLYLRLTTLRRENIAIKVLACYVAFGFIFMEVFYFAVWCRPFYNYWAVPTPNVQCDAATNHLITNAVFNLSSDLAMLAIGLPMFIRMSLPWKKKIPLIGIFSLGVFVILAAILNKVYSFTLPFGVDWTFWYVRESSTALLVANLPFVWTVWRKVTGGRTNCKTLDRVSRQDSGVPGSLDRTEMWQNPTHRLRPAIAQSPETAHGQGGNDELDIADMAPTTNAMSLADILNEGHPAPAQHEDDPNPITHPHLFYSSGRQAALTPRHDSQPNGCTNHAALRSNSDVELHFSGTPASSVFPQSLTRTRSEFGSVADCQEQRCEDGVLTVSSVDGWKPCLSMHLKVSTGACGKMKKFCPEFVPRNECCRSLERRGEKTISSVRLFSMVGSRIGRARLSRLQRI
nr:hypothetical protein CFP56_60247 [Quercus suber]